MIDLARLACAGIALALAAPSGHRDGGSPPPRTRTYYVAADTLVWDYAPGPEVNLITGRPYDSVARFVIGNDSAAVHIAAVFNVKSLTLFSGSALFEEWGAYGKNAFILTKDVICRECELSVCDKKVHECMEFGVEEVEKLAHKIIAGKQKNKVIKI